MKKILFPAVALSLAFAATACSDSKKTDTPAAEPAATETAAADPAAEEAVVAYERYLVKYDSLTARSQAGKDETDALLNLMDESIEISEKLISTESKRTPEQQARVKAVEKKIDSIKALVLKF